MTSIKKLILFGLAAICVLCTISQAAQIVRYVDPDAAGTGTGLSWANAYTSLNAWNTAEAQNLTDGGGDYATVYCRSSAGTHDTTLATIGTGWTTSATCYIEVIGADFPADGIYDGSKYVLHNNNSGTYALTIQETYVHLINLQILVTCTGSTARHGAYFYSNYGFMDSCIVKGTVTGSALCVGVYLYFAAYTQVYNTTIYGFTSTTPSGYGIFISNSGSTKYFNCTIFDCRTGIYIHATSTTTIIKNCAIGNSTDDIYYGQPGTTTNCCTDDGDGTNAQGPLGGNWANEFVTPGTDFDLLAGGNCVGNGTDNPGAGLYSDDIIGTARSSTWDIGAFEYVTPPAAGGQVISIEGDD